MVAAKPSIVDQKFSMLTCIGKGSVQKTIDRHGMTRSRGLWKFRCDCGNVVELPRAYVEKNGQKSCGCLSKNRKELIDNKRRPKDITGQRFGELVAVRLTGKKDSSHKPTWLMQCDCGGTAEWSLSKLLKYTQADQQIHCRDLSVHQVGLWYPPTPSPYPKEAGELLEKYLWMTQTQLKKRHQQIEDAKRDRLIRTCWIVTYRRQQGEQITELEEENYIRKSLRYCSIGVFWSQKIEEHGGLLYTNFGSKKQIGSRMTDLTLQNYPVSESGTLGNNLLPAPKRLKFKRC